MAMLSHIQLFLHLHFEGWLLFYIHVLVVALPSLASLLSIDRPTTTTTTSGASSSSSWQNHGGVTDFEENVEDMVCSDLQLCI